MGRRRYERFARSAQACEKTPDGRFWKIDGDPSLNFRRPFLSWIRKEYDELNEIIHHESKDGRYTIFIVLGTAGCGKSQFAVQFALNAAHNGRILFKKGKRVYIIDGAQGSAEGPFTMESPEVEDLLDDDDSWLVIDGKQEEQLDCGCKVLVACSTRKTNYEELGKLGEALTLYLSAWSREEVRRFLQDFEPYRKEYQLSMLVPTEKRALQVFESLGGAARYVLQARKRGNGLQRWDTAIHDLGNDVNAGASVLAGSFLDDVSDRIIHMFASENHRSFRRELASDATITELHRAYRKGGLAHTAAFLERTVSVSVAGPLWGKLYESVVVQRFSSGYNRLRCKLSQADRNQFVDIEPRKVETFGSLEQLRDLLASDEQEELFCFPENACLESVDAAMLWNNTVVLLQIFKRKTGVHGLKVNGLEHIDAVLARTSYEVWSCVPAEYYEQTGPQNYTTVHNKKYRGRSEVIPKITQRVVEVDYRWTSKKRRKQQKRGVEEQEVTKGSKASKAGKQKKKARQQD